MKSSRFQFWTCKWAQGMSFDNYYTKLRQLAKTCKFHINEEDKLNRDKIMFSLDSLAWKSRLLREKNLDLKRTVEMCRVAETAEIELTAMKKPDKSVDSIRGREGLVYYSCWCCGKQHEKDKCAARNKTCWNCGKVGHFRQYCKKVSRKNEKTGDFSKKQNCRFSNKKLHPVERDAIDSDDQSEAEWLFLDSLKVDTIASEKGWMEEIKIQGTPVAMKIDSGAETNTIPLKIWERLPNRPPIQPSKVKLWGYSYNLVQHVGVAHLWLRKNNRCVKSLVFIVKESEVPILGLEAAEDLKILSRGQNAKSVCALEVKSITMETLKKNYGDVFRGLGKYPGLYKIQLKDGGEPSIRAPYNVPHKLRDRLKSTLEDLVRQGVIEPVDEPTDWVNRLVIAEKKDGSLRLSGSRGPESSD